MDGNELRDRRYCWGSQPEKQLILAPARGMVNRGEWNSGDVPTSPLPTIPHRQRLRKNRQGTLIKRAAMGRMVRIQLDMLGVSSLSRRLLTAPIL